PTLHESADVVGTVLPVWAEKFGLASDVKVVAGAGDNAAAAIGTGAVGEGKCNISLGTSGTVFISSEHFTVDKANALHAFCHADGGYHLMGCMLSAASCNKWFVENVLSSKEYDALFAGIGEEKLGANDVYFLPYLMGERSPINDTDARGVFIGMTPETSREDMLLAVIEGVSFAIRDSLEVAKAQGITFASATLCGGGAKLPVWRKVLANVLDLPLVLPVSEEGPGYGGAVLAMTADGIFSDVKTGAATLFKERERVTPDGALAERYAKKYENFKKIYPALKTVFKEIRD
ncbi:MAG: xylulokinase, partial [Clostridia bacterium]|nr:xylulokinase [Clostridia bacterium]